MEERASLSDRMKSAAAGVLRAVGLGNTATYLLSPPGGLSVRRGTLDWLNAYSQSPWVQGIVSAIANAVAANAQSAAVFVPDRTGGAPKRTMGSSAWGVTRTIFDDPADRLTMRDLLRARIVSTDVGARAILPAKWRGLATRAVPGRMVEGHPADGLLENPNPDMSGFDLWNLKQVHEELAGDAFWLKERDARGKVAALYPIAPHYLRRTPTRLEPWFLFTFWGQTVPIPREEVVWFKNFDPANPMGQGVSVAMSVEDEVASDEKASKLAARLFDNDATPRLALQYEGDMTESQVERVRALWTDKFRGVWNQYKPAIVYGSLKEIKIIGATLRDMEFKNLREWNAKVVRGAWQTPGVLLGQMEDANRANAEAALYQWALVVLSPRLVRNQGVVDRDLLSEWPEFRGAWFEHRDPVERDRERDARIASQAWNDGAITQNEYREILEQDPVAEGDRFKAARSYAYVKRLDEVAGLDPAMEIQAPQQPAALPPAPEEKPKKPALPPASEPDDEDEDAPRQDGKAGRNGRARKFDAGGSSPYRTMTMAELGSWACRALEAKTEPVEERFKPRLRAFFERQRVAVMERLGAQQRVYAVSIHRSSEEDDARAVLGALKEWLEEWGPDAVSAAMPFLVQAADDGGTTALESVAADAAFDVQSPEAKALLAARSQRFAQRINETTWTQLKDSLVEGIEKGETLRDMEKRISDVMDIARGHRTNMIARTEIVGAYNAAALLGYKQGGVEAKTWFTAADERVRDTHGDAGERYGEGGAIPLEEDFQVGEGAGPCPGSIGLAEEDINCRCVSLPAEIEAKEQRDA